MSTDMRSSVVQFVDDAACALRLLGALPGILRHPFTPALAVAELRRRLARREANFLWLARRVVYRAPSNPLRRLLAQAGCEQGDLIQLVKREGLDQALHRLYRQGVYLTLEEFKRGRPIVRGSSSFVINPSDLLNPLAARHLPGETGGSRGVRTPAPVDLRRERDYSLARAIHAGSVGSARCEFATWQPPGSLPFLNMIDFFAAGVRPARWFSQVDPGGAGLSPRYRWSAELLCWGGLLAGVHFPRPRTVPLSEPGPIARWLSESVRSGHTPFLMTSSSAAVRVAEAALADGLDLSGARFILTSEPATPGRQAAIRRTGALPVPNYGSMEVGAIADGCLDRQFDDDMHLYDDLHGVIQPGSSASGTSGLTAQTLLFTSLYPRCPFVLINVSIGDQGVITPARCDCPIQQSGWPRMLHSVRSFEKLSIGGTTLLDVDVVRVIEEVLPRQFGGGPLDYQLLELFDGDGRSALRLLAHPRLGPLDESALLEAFLAALAGDGAERIRELLWRQGQMLRVDRLPPRLTAAGKVLHLHQESTSRVS